MATSRKRRPNPQLVKIHRTYTVEEIARLYDVHRNTVRNWIGRGLQPIDDRRPYLVLGSHLRAFLTDERRKSKSPCPPGHFYCLKCRTPRKPAGGLVEYIARTDISGNLRAICPDCETLMHRCVSRRRLQEVCADLEITFAEPASRIGDDAMPTVNCDSKEGDGAHENA